MAERFEAAGFRVLWLPDAGGAAVRLLRLTRLLRRERVDILHCHNPLANVQGTLAGRLAGVRGIITTRHAISLNRKSGQSWRAESMVSRLAHRQIAVAEGVRRTAVQTGRMRASKSVVIYNGVDTKRYIAAPRNGSKGHTVVGCVARLSGNKRHCDVIEAVRLLRDRGRDVRFHVVGDGAERQALEAKVKELGLENRVVFFGSRGDVPELLHSFDIFVLASRLEGLPLTILEAMSSGLPVVATEVGSVSEIVTEGETGFMVPPDRPDKLAEALDRLVQDAALRRRMGEAGRKRAEAEFSLEVAAKKHAEIYWDVLRREGSKAV